MVPEGGARPMIVDDYESRSVAARGPTLYPAKSTLLVYLEMVMSIAHDSNLTLSTGR